MTLKITLFSQEVEDFVMELIIDSEAKFQELHELILKDCNYEEREGNTFLICDEDWRVQTNIRLKDTGQTGYDEDLYLMKNCTVGEFLEEERQRLAYIFDPEGKRFFLMELSEIIFGRSGEKARVGRKHGHAPLQSLEQDDYSPLTTTDSTINEDEEFYGSDGFEDEELDMEGFEINE